MGASFYFEINIMATYISLTNELLRRINEVNLDSNDFALARNVQALAKDAINSSIREIMQSAQEWPFAIVTYTQTLTAGVGVYSLPADASSVDWSSFYLKLLPSVGNSPRQLPVISYDKYLNMHRPIEDMNGVGGYGVPLTVYQTQEMKFGVTPLPSDAFEIEYKYWSYAPDLSVDVDVPVIPDRFKHIIIDGAMMYMMTFRSNEQSAAIHRDKFQDGIKMMRRLLLDEPLAVTSSVIINQQNTFSRVA